MNKPEFIILHHSWSADAGLLSDYEAIKKYHMEVKGWRDIGYHFVLEYANNIAVVKRGRDVLNDGAHALMFNERSIGICIVGNYDIAPLQLDKKTKLIWLLCHLKYVFNIQTAHIIGHRDTYVMLNQPIEKTCPGNQINLDEIRSAVDYSYME